MTRTQALIIVIVVAGAMATVKYNDGHLYLRDAADVVIGKERKL